MQPAYLTKSPAATTAPDGTATATAAAATTTTPTTARPPRRRRLPWAREPAADPGAAAATSTAAVTPWTLARPPRHSTRTSTSAITIEPPAATETPTTQRTAADSAPMSAHTTPGRHGGRFARGRVGGRANRTPRKAKAFGLLENGAWFCDCRDQGGRLRAERFRVRKEGPNKGRWFWTCPVKGEAGCGFFAWDGEGGDGGGVGGSGGGSGGPATTNGAAKRKLQEEVNGGGYGEEAETEDEDEEDEYGWGKDAGVEDVIEKVLEASTPTSTPAPRKALKTRDGATPGGSSMMTPVSARKGVVDSAVTPTPARFGTTTMTTPSSVNGDDAADDTLVPKVLNLLKERGVNLDKDTGDALQELLHKGHSLPMQGAVRGRNIARLAVRERNAKITELHARITALEAELETQKAVIANLNWQRETGQFD